MVHDFLLEPKEKGPSKKAEEKTYSFFINNNQENKKCKYPNNTIKTTKYNIFTFLPLALLFQFMRPANCYFLFIAILNCIPIISPLASGIALVPIIFVLAVSLVRELIEDIIRARIDKDQNTELVERYNQSEGKWDKVRSGLLQVGEIIKVNQDCTFPADVIILTSNLPEGICYIETGTLDGEKSLKIKQAVIQTASLLPDTSIDKIAGFSICDMPNPFLYHLIGRLKASIKGTIVEVPLDSKQLLLKGAKLRNTKWVIGIIVYAGGNCKIMLNAKKPRMKYSKIELLMNKLLLVVLAFQMLLCVVSAILHKVYHKADLLSNPYLNKLEHSLNVDSVINFFTFVLLLNTMIPISLIITMEIVKIIQVILFLWDAGGYSLLKNRSIKPNSVNLNEELGMVDYIFTDKTGTLTCNKMEFKYCVIGDVCYEYVASKKKEESDNSNEDIIKFTQGEMLNESKRGLLTIMSSFPKLNLCSEKAECVLNTSLITIEEFWKALALCHDCTIDRNGDTEEYIGLSPDSIELVRAAKDQGFKYTDSGKSSIRRIQMGESQFDYKDYEKLLLIEFTSERKREAIVLKDNGIIKLYIKGADNVIAERLSKNSPKEFLSQSQRYVDHFSSKGYRTLFVAMKIFENKEWDDIERQLREANLDLANKYDRLKAVYDVIEKDLYILGATIVEDKLQDQVPETIVDMKLAGIKIWMLTGDKMSTAYNIALSCNLLNKNLKTFFIEGVEIIRDDKLSIINKDECEKVIITFAKQFVKFSGEQLSIKAPYPFGIVIDEKALLTVSNNTQMSNLFLNIAKDAKSVICCRVSPLQKSKVVKMMKDYDPSKIALAIGDGGNDVSMIMEANIGIGIYGEEGLRAVQSSDYAIGEFKIMRRLLFFHGRTSNIRICDMILYFFYKNFIFTIIHFFFGFYSNFSGQTIIDDWFINMYNLLFTAFPLGARACMDFDVKPEDGLIIDKMLPFLYKDNRANPHLTKLSFFFCILRGIIHAVINYFMTINCFSVLPANSNGDLSDIWFISVALYTNIIIIVSVNLIINTKFHTWINLAIMTILTFLAYLLFLIIVHFWTLFNSVATMEVAFSSSDFWMNLVLVTGACGLFDLGVKVFEVFFDQKLSSSLELLVHQEGQINDSRRIESGMIQKHLMIYDRYAIESSYSNEAITKVKGNTESRESSKE